MEENKGVTGYHEKNCSYESLFKMFFCIQVQLRSLKTSFGFFPSLSYPVQAILFWAELANQIFCPLCLSGQKWRLKMLWEEPNSQITQGADKQWGHLPITNCKLFTPQVIRNWTEHRLSYTQDHWNDSHHALPNTESRHNLKCQFNPKSNLWFLCWKTAQCLKLD